jgi:hypothetical protein
MDLRLGRELALDVDKYLASAPWSQQGLLMTSGGGKVILSLQFSLPIVVPRLLISIRRTRTQHMFCYAR